jgi:hypothetical protein
VAAEGALTDALGMEIRLILLSRPFSRRMGFRKLILGVPVT